MGKNFVILGMGYVSPKHLKAIKDVGGNLIAYHDTSSVVGHADQYFINALYYKEFIHFDCFIDRCLHDGTKIDYAVILLPNHLHNPACRWAMTRGMDVICEKPVVLYEKNIDELLGVEARTGKEVNVIQQMRLHPEAQRFINDSTKVNPDKSKILRIVYNTPRGHWFRHDGGWKSDPRRSGGLFSAIGIHFADLVSLAFGRYIRNKIHQWSNEKIKGVLMLDKMDVLYDLSVSPNIKVERIFEMNKKSYDFTSGFDDLHSESYRQILAGKGFTLEDARMGVRICERIREQCRS